MVGGEEHERQVDRSPADLHQYGIGEIARGCFRIGLTRKCRRELKGSPSGSACGMSRHEMIVRPSISVN